MKVAEVVVSAIHAFIDWQSTQPEAVCASLYHNPTNAHTAVYDFLRRAEVDPHTRVEDWLLYEDKEVVEGDLVDMTGLAEALGINVATDLSAHVRSLPDISIIEQDDETWFLPLTAAGERLVGRVIPKNARRFGSHFILCGAVGHAIATSLRKAGAA